MSALPFIAAESLRAQWAAFHQALSSQVESSVQVIWRTFAPPIHTTAGFLRLSYAHRVDPDPPTDRCTQAEGCAHLWPDRTQCNRKPVPASRPVRCARHVRHTIALVALAGHIERRPLRGLKRLPQYAQRTASTDALQGHMGP